ncbi:hypothetical protein D1AOALGA4SA_5999, partial [Olavius algarvensis Delta 1 endosymbiont]
NFQILGLFISPFRCSLSSIYYAGGTGFYILNYKVNVLNNYRRILPINIRKSSKKIETIRVEEI